MYVENIVLLILVSVKHSGSPSETAPQPRRLMEPAVDSDEADDENEGASTSECKS